MDKAQTPEAKKNTSSLNIELFAVVVRCGLIKDKTLLEETVQIDPFP
jgi:hypothetical protein